MSEPGGATFRGVFTPVITVFDGRGVDYDAETRLVERLIEAGVDGILFCGSIGEFQAMTAREKGEFFRWAAGAVGRRVKALAGTGGTCVEEALALTCAAGDAGIDAAVAISPYYFRLDDESLYRYYAALAGVGLPVLLYNFPDRTNVSLSPGLVKRLALDFGAIVGIKDTVDTISHTREIIAAVKPARPEFSVLSGFDEYFLPNLMAGGDGILTGMTNVAPGVFTALYRAWNTGDLMEMKRLQLVVNKLMGLYAVTDPFVGAIKAAVDMMAGGIPADPRPPFIAATPGQRGRIRAILGDAGLMEGINR